MTSIPAEEAPWQQRVRQIASIAGQIDRKEFSTGDRAALRRLNPDHPSYGGLAVVLRVLRNAGLELDRLGTRQLARWTLLVHAMAITAGPGRSPHARRKTGSALHEASYSESRLMRLLEARGSTRDGLFVRLARLLAAKGLAIDWAALAPLVLDDEEGEAAERARLRITRDYYAAEARAKATEGIE